MEFTNTEILRAHEPLEQLMKAKFPVLVAYGLAKLANAVGAQYKVIEATREALVMSHGTPVEGMPTRKQIQPGDKGFPEFAVEFGTLLAETTDVDFEVVEIPFTVGATCGTCHERIEIPLEIEPYVLVALERFIKVAAPAQTLQELVRR